MDKLLFRALLSCGLIFTGSCAAFAQNGDAKVSVFKRAVFPWDMGRVPAYDVELPSIPLNKVGTTEFTVRSLPTPRNHYEYYLERTGRLVPGVSVAVRVATLDGKVLFQAEKELTKLSWNRPGSHAQCDKFFAPDFLHPAPFAKARDYKVSITIKHPSAGVDGSLQIKGFAPL